MKEVKSIKVLRASAGSGKTFSLTVHYLSLLFEDSVRFSEILAITFTNKATAEMKDRILRVLAGIASGEVAAAPYLNALAANGMKKDAALWKEEARRHYRQILHDYSRFSVSTIDGFIQKIIRSFTFELGISSGFKLEMNQQKVKQELVSRLHLLLDNRPDLLNWIMDYAENKIQQGKSWNYRSTLLDLTNELFKERFNAFGEAIRAIPEESRKSAFDTLHAWGKEKTAIFENKIASRLESLEELYAQFDMEPAHFLKKSHNPLTKLSTFSRRRPLTSKDVEDLLKMEPYVDQVELWGKEPISSEIKTFFNSANPILKELFTIYREESPEYFLIQTVETNLYYLRLLSEMQELLSAYRAEHAVLLISDAQNLLRNLTKIGGNTSFIWEKMGSRYRFFLFDEFQDTSRNQWANLYPLLENALGSPSLSMPEHLIVGDIKQSIYRWRNGDWQILHRSVSEQVGDKRIVQATLEENYRSHRQVIEFNNFLFRHSPAIAQEALNQQVRDALPTELYRSWWAESGNDSLLVQAYSGHAQRFPEGTKKTAGRVQLHFLPVESNHDWARRQSTQAASLEAMVTKLQSWFENGTYKPSQIGILVRTNAEARLVVNYLLTNQGFSGNPGRYDVVSAEALLLSENRAVKLLIFALKAMSSATSDRVFYLANVCYLLRLIQKEQSSDDAFFMSLQDADVSDLSTHLPRAWSENWDNWQQIPLAESVEKLISAFSLASDPLHLPYLLAFRDLIAYFNQQGERGISPFIDYWEEEGIFSALPNAEGVNAVEVLTIHKSKGLAFDVVLIPFCNWNLDGQGIIWPETAETPYQLLGAVPVAYQASLAHSSLYKHYFEEMLHNYLDALNVLYVANTRAVKELHLFAPDVKGDKGGVKLIADLLRMTIADYGHELGLGFKEEIRYPDKAEQEAHVDEDLPDSPPDTLFWSFESYPIEGALLHTLNSGQTPSDTPALEVEKARKSGILLHEILSRIAHPDALDKELDQLSQEGLLPMDERENIRLQVLKVLSHPILISILNAPEYRQLNERSIIDRDGRIWRPDKIFVGKNDTILVDFKFTLAQQETHRRQIRNYKDLLGEMGYHNVKAYLVYGLDTEVNIIEL